MDEIFFLEKPALFLNQSPLKYFISFLKQLNEGRPFRFSYVAKDAPLIPNLTLRENLLLESIPPSLSRSKEFCLNDYIKKLENEFLSQLFLQIESLDLYPIAKEVDEAQKKNLSFLMAFLKENDFLFIEEFSDPPELFTLIQSLVYKEWQSTQKNRSFVIYGKQQNSWQDLITTNVTYSAKGEFILQKIPPSSKSSGLTFINF